MNIKMIKIHQGRKRFYKKKPPLDLYHWQSDLNEIKAFLLRETRLQMVGNKVYFEARDCQEDFALMIEVVGQPGLLEQKALSLFDRESCVVLVHKLEVDLFSIGPEELKKTVFGLKRALEASFWQDQDKLSDIFNIVFDYDKIELHFFRQKDYIQKQF